MAADAGDVFAIVVEAAALRRAILADQRQRLRVRALEADEDARAAGRAGHARQLVVVAEIDRDLRDPALVETSVGHRLKQFQAALARSS